MQTHHNTTQHIMKLLAQSYLISNKKIHPRHYNTISEWQWHTMNDRFIDLPYSLDLAMNFYNHLIPYILYNGATLCELDHKGRIKYLLKLFIRRQYNNIDILLSYPPFTNELRTKPYKFYYPYDDIDGARILVKHGYQFRSSDIAYALMYDSYNLALFMCDHTCDDLWYNETNIDYIDKKLYNMIIKSTNENIQKIGCDISKKLFPVTGHHL